MADAMGLALRVEGKITALALVVLLTWVLILLLSWEAHTAAQQFEALEIRVEALEK
jgi:succinate dehydrogenase hydrophobic anchor subunit